MMQNNNKNDGAKFKIRQMMENKVGVCGLTLRKDRR